MYLPPGVRQKWIGVYIVKTPQDPHTQVPHKCAIVISFPPFGGQE